MNTTFRVNTTLDHHNHDQAITRAIVAAQAGDMEAIRFLYLRYKDNVYGYVLSIVREQHEAEDCTQQVFMKLISAIHKYEPRTVPFTAWILRVARNIAIDHLRQRRAVPREEVFEPTRQTDESSRECRWGLEAALESLPEEQRDVVVLRHLVGLTPGEIATRMGRTESSIHGLHHRGRLTLRRELADMDCAPDGQGRVAALPVRPGLLGRSARPAPLRSRVVRAPPRLAAAEMGAWSGGGLASPRVPGQVTPTLLRRNRSPKVASDGGVDPEAVLRVASALRRRRIDDPTAVSGPRLNAPCGVPQPAALIGRPLGEHHGEVFALFEEHAEVDGAGLGSRAVGVTEESPCRGSWC